MNLEQGLTLVAQNSSEARGIRKGLRAAGMGFAFTPAHSPRCGARELKPVSEITDRQKRYRSRKCIDKSQLRRCAFCGSPRNMRIHHLNGREDDYSQKNLIGACHACNAKIGHVLKRHNIGRRVDLEYKKNPEAKPARSLAQWVIAVKTMRGESNDMTPQAAIAMIRATSPARRSHFAQDIWKIRRAKGTDRKVPF